MAGGAFSRDVRELILARDGGCIRCGAWTPQIHHRRPRSAGGTSLAWVGEASNGLTLCGSGTTGCHGWVESHRDEAKAHGWIIPATWKTLPALEPCWFPLLGGWFLLHPDGTRSPWVDEPAF